MPFGEAGNKFLPKRPQETKTDDFDDGGFDSQSKSSSSSDSEIKY